MQNTKKWLTEFLLIRLINPKSLSQPLYSYEVTEEEYVSLSACLINDKNAVFDTVHGVSWAACFCLFVSERYRREYDGSEGGWSWQGADAQLGLALNHDQRKQIVSKGLKYWGRPLRQREAGTDYLGSLFAEGGLPWRLLSSDAHGFGRAIKHGIRNYDSAKKSGTSLLESIKDYSQYFPITFRNQETYILLTSVVESLMALAQAHDLRTQAEPAAFLDEHHPDWRTSFPLPIGQANGKTLVNEWLKNAGAKQKEIEEAKEKAKSFTCNHVLKGNLHDLQIESTVFLPRQEEISLTSTLSSTRLEMVFFEGDKRILSAGVLYGKLDDDRSRVTVNFPHTEYKLLRKNVEQPLMLQLLSNGSRVEAYYFQNSDLNLVDAPLVVSDAEEHQVIANASCYVSSSSILVRCPRSISLEPNNEHFSEDIEGGKWFRVEQDVRLHSDDNDFELLFREHAEYSAPIMRGRLCLLDSLPNLTFYDHPTIEFQDKGSDALDNKVVLIEGKHAGKIRLWGQHILELRSQKGNNLFRKKIGILPPDLSISSSCSTAVSAAHIYLRTSENLSVQVDSDVLHSTIENDGFVTSIKLEPRYGAQIPARVSLKLKSAGANCDSVILRLPYPHNGVILFDSAGEVVSKVSISLSELLGMTMQISSGLGYEQSFYMVAELHSSMAKRLKRNYQFKVSKHPVAVSLYAFHDDLMQLLSTVSDQDAFIRVRIETDQLIKQFELTRYSGQIENLEQSGVFNLLLSSPDIEHSVIPIGVNLADPAENPQAITRRLSAGIETDLFDIPHSMSRKGPFLIVPSVDSKTLFRPSIWVGPHTLDYKCDVNDDQPGTLHQAAALYHPIHNPAVFNQVVAAMALDMSHSGWIYIDNLKERYSYLPLSVFMAWQAISQNTQALALMVMRLDIDYLFCQRLVNDLAVIWEAVTVQEWLLAIDTYSKYLQEMGIPDATVQALVLGRLQKVESVIPVLKHLPDYILTGNPEKVHGLPEFPLLSLWYQELRRRHADDNRWPEYLDEQLETWILSEDEYRQYLNMVNLGFEKAVVFFPIYMAHLTIGHASLEQFQHDFSETRFALRLLSDFDREAWYEPVYALVLSNLIIRERHQ